MNRWREEPNDKGGAEILDQSMDVHVPSAASTMWAGNEGGKASMVYTL